MHRIADVTSYDTRNPHGLEFRAHDVDATGMPAVEIQFTPTDLAFALCAMIDKYGLDNVRRTIDRIALDDPTGKRVGLSSPAKILMGIDPRKAG